jgi:CRISPR-associated exonuclease Cas4
MDTSPTLPLPLVDPEGAAAAPLMVTHILEHLFCPRFTYFEYVLGVKERQERRPLVQKGREVHEERRKINAQYLRKKLGVVDRKFDVHMASAALGVRGIVDEVLTLADGSMAPFDYKFAKDPGQVYHNQKMQSVLYALLIRETFQVPVRRGFICYTRSNFKVVELVYTEDDFAEAGRITREVLNIIQTGLFPRATPWKARCLDCCYRNICIQ